MRFLRAYAAGAVIVFPLLLLFMSGMMGRFPGRTWVIVSAAVTLVVAAIVYWGGDDALKGGGWLWFSRSEPNYDFRTRSVARAEQTEEEID